MSRAKFSASEMYSSSVQARSSGSTDEAESLPLSSSSSSSSSLDRLRLLPEADSRSGSVMVVSLLATELKEIAAGAKLLSALGRCASGGIVVSIISHASCGVGLRLRSPSPLTGESGRHDRLKGWRGRLVARPPSGRNRLSPSGSDWSRGGVGRTVRGASTLSCSDGSAAL